MKKVFWTGVIFCLCLGKSLAATEVVDRIVAVVGDEIITLSDVKSYSAERSFAAKIGGPESKSAKDPLEALIREKILKAEMEHLGIVASEEEVNNAVRDVADRNKVTQEALKSELARKGIPFARYKKDVGDEIRRMKFLSQVIFPRIRIADEEIAGKTAGDSSEGARVRARMQILQDRSPAEVDKYLDEIRAKTFVEIKK